MNEDLETLKAALTKADGYLTLRMWEQAWNVLEDLPSELINHPDVLAFRLDVMVGVEQWEKGIYLATGVLEVYPQRADLWLRMARLQAGNGNIEGAQRSAQRCIALDGEMRVAVVEDEGLKGIW